MTIQQIVAIDDIAKAVHKNAEEHGFYEDIQNVLDYCTVNDQPRLYAISTMNFTLAQLAKISSEAGEAVECIQKNKSEDEFVEELADILIRTLDLAAWIGLPIGNAVAKKMQKNALRPYKHGGVC
jgi:NTP pyrophosphatase (non-canonical NTP hydrolase)